MNLVSLIQICVELNASDLHLALGLVPHVRIDGIVQPMDNEAAISQDMMKGMLNEILTEQQIKILEKSLEYDLCATYYGHRCRIHIFHAMHGMAIAIRILQHKIPSLQEIGLTSVFNKQLDIRNGLILVTGATGSGKSTTIAAMINYINDHYNKRIITIEDPVEFVFHSHRSLITQRQVNKDAHNYASALRGALREDPDVIMIGELRDLKSIRMALTAAETGHLVIATLHTSCAISTINRIIDVFPASDKSFIRQMLADSLNSVVNQKLFKKKDNGRIAAFEILVNTTAVKNLIRENNTTQIVSIMQTNRHIGMCTMDQAIENLYARGGIHQIETSHII